MATVLDPPPAKTDPRELAPNARRGPLSLLRVAVQRAAGFAWALLRGAFTGK